MLLGALLIALGFRGQKSSNNHPTCRDCGFDLENVYQTAGVTCPECGAGLKRDRGIRIGQRRRRPIFIGLGLLFIALPAAPIGVAAFALLTGNDFNTYKPLGVLLWEGGRAPTSKTARASPPNSSRECSPASSTQPRKPASPTSPSPARKTPTSLGTKPGATSSNAPSSTAA